MKLKDKVCFLGVGCCGGKQAKEFHKMGYKAFAVNGSEQDLKSLGDMPKYELKGFDGFGGRRDRALECLAANKDFMDFISNINEEIVFVLFGGGGSTGSGCGTLISEMLMEEKDDDDKPIKIVCPIISLPSSDEASGKHKNAYQAVQELQDLDSLGATFFINNDAYKDYSFINETFAKSLNTLLSDDAYSDRNNFDEAERIEMLRDSGAMVLNFVPRDKEQSLMLDRLTKTGIFAPVEKDKVCEKIGIIHADNNEKDIDREMVITEVGKPTNVFEGYNNKKGTLIVVSGLSYPLTHVTKLGEMVLNAQKERQRNRKQTTQKLADLLIVEEEPAVNPKQTKKKPSKLDMLKRMTS
ncbi:hypothetical protein [Anaerotignum sp.]